TLRLLRAVIGAVDLDRGQLRRGVGQLLRLREFFGIKHPAPRLECPAADADIDVAAVCRGRFRWLAHGRARRKMRGGLRAMLTKPDPIGQIVAVATSSRNYGIAAKCDSPGYGHGSSFDGEWTWHLARQLQSRRHCR